jgi:hypothetical protein
MKKLKSLIKKYKTHNNFFKNINNNRKIIIKPKQVK